ncbi:angiogenic factor with G patch and FHA domains 1 isoform X2 [Episyrphus balteatus]|uniref:angiogenic factor with G patch and FHA domains 1 isoform X2 n=1 Tax=Episyrphus balteatus TaxID=286459 RepID=UPI002485ED16|nr:angiogenic factor with G patch and FHA domains 1 isoform X2 [Episyrphus balteatus]
MSSETEDNKSIKSSKHKSKKSSKFVLKTVKFLRNNCTHGEIYSYIDGLHDQLKKQQKKIKKYKDKIKKLTKKIHNLKIEKKDSPPNEKKTSESVVETIVEKKEDAEPKPPLTLAEEIREAAEAAQNDNGFVYEPTSGLYYDQRTGYYYNAEYGLYYDGSNGCYYKYDQENNKFEFHSQVEVQQSEEAEKADDLNGESRDSHESRQKESKRKAKKRRRLEEKEEKKKTSQDEDEGSKDSKEREDGELNSSASSDSDDSVEELKENGQYQDIARKYPPSLRIIVQETNLDKLQEGALNLITFKGGTLGREGDHDVIIPDLNVSKFHLKFTYDEKREVYTCIDLGSRNGTLLNGKRMSSSKQESDPMDLVHGSVVQLSQTKLLCHVHPGNSTCGQCEPGLLMESKEEASKIVTLSHKQQLKKLQQKYGLENEKFVENRKAAGYNDRAATRRVKVGSSNDKEKTEMASVDTEISSENKGFKMLSKLGWNKGTALGKADSGGLLEPISVNSNEGHKGLGCEDYVPTLVSTKMSKKKLETWKKTQERYNKVSEVNVFSSSDDEDLLS